MDWNNMQLWHWFAIAGGVVLLLGVILHFLPIGKIKVPAVITASFGALAAGLALGIIFMAGFGYRPLAPEPQDDGINSATEPKMGQPKGGRGKGVGKLKSLQGNLEKK